MHNSTSTERHEFALYIADLTDIIKKISTNKELCIVDEKIIHRMIHVLRLKPEDYCILFDRITHARVVIKKIDGKKHIICMIQSTKLNTVFSPTVTFLLPLLKREDFESALYALTEVGVTTIQLVKTSKSHSSLFDNKFFERAQRIIIAAAEQSKNFAYPELKMPLSLFEAIAIADTTTKIFFDEKGISLFSTAQSLHRNPPNDIVLLIGPEGDLSNEEKEMVISKKFIVCALTPTILRSIQAAVLSAGLVRALLR